LGNGIDVLVGVSVMIGSTNVLLGSAGDACSLSGVVVLNLRAR